MRPMGVRRADSLDLPTQYKLSHLLRPETLFKKWWCRPRLAVRIRKNAASLTVEEWARFVCAVETIMKQGVGAPTYQDLVDLHVLAMSQSWGAHGSNFLAWHREYLLRFEARLRLVNPLVTIPYWDWTANPTPPAEVSDPAALTRWGVTRRANIGPMPSATQVANVMSNTTFPSFQPQLQSVHNQPHNSVGGTMATAGSPADPVFWMHHAFIDKIWADWQKVNSSTTAKPPNLTEVLQPPPVFKLEVSQTLSTVRLGYVYA